jgi:uncharacterized protein YjbJ (UPF0337 family)
MKDDNMNDSSVNDRSLTKDGIKNSVEGKATDLKGKIKDAAGGLTGDTKLQVEGKIDQVKGKVQDAFGKSERNADQNLKDANRDANRDA